METVEIKVWGDIAVKFRAFGIDFGYAKKSIPADQAAVFKVPFAFKGVFPVVYNDHGVKLNLYIGA